MHLLVDNSRIPVHKARPTSTTSSQSCNEMMVLPSNAPSDPEKLKKRTRPVFIVHGFIGFREASGSPQTTLSEIYIHLHSLHPPIIAEPRFQSLHRSSHATQFVPVDAPGVSVRVSRSHYRLYKHSPRDHMPSSCVPRRILLGQTPSYANVVPLCCPDAHGIVVSMM